MDAPAIRPRTAIEIVDASFALFRANFATMAVIGLAASVPIAILAGVMLTSVTGGAGWMTPLMRDTTAWVPLFFVVMAGIVFWMAIVDGAMVFAAAEAYHGNRPTPADAIRGAFSKGLSLVGGNVLRIVIVGAGGAAVAGAVAVVVKLLDGRAGGFLAFVIIVAGIVLFFHLLARTFAITSAIVIERRTAAEGVSRSFALSENATLRIVGIVFLAGTVYMVAQTAGSMMVQLVVGLLLRSPVAAAVLGNVAGMVVYPFLNIALMVLYFDQRVRKEGYDLDVLSSAMPPVPATQP
jgi:hypothetical protein